MANRLATIRELYAVFPDTIAMSDGVTVSFETVLPPGETITIGNSEVYAAGDNFDGTARDFARVVNTGALALAVLDNSDVTLHPLTREAQAITTSDDDAITLVASTLPPVSTLVALMYDNAAAQVDLAIWGEKASVAHALLTADLLVLMSVSATGRFVKKRKFDILEEEYFDTAGSGSSFRQLYDQLAESLPVFGAVGVDSSWPVNWPATWPTWVR